jgi:molybdate transport system ATP-binding protein
MQQPSIIVNNLSVKQQGQLLLNGINFSLQQNGHLLITGTSGCGKTMLAKTLAGQLFHSGEVVYGKEKPAVLMVDQHYHFKTLSNTKDFYYQQRYNSFGSNDALTVIQELQLISDDNKEIETLLDQLQLNHRINDSLLHLSSGEHKRFQLIKAFLQHADVLILDSPFIGLDIASREILRTLINAKSSTTTIIIIADVHDAPSCITDILLLENGEQKAYEKHSSFIAHHSSFNIHHSTFNGVIPAQQDEADFDVAVQMENVSIAYGEKKILSNISWQINRGDRWLLKGHNGAGKSTLLSLITGDHPQAYANKIVLFDKKRGTGESIWDIKRKIGYVSPELHWYFDANTSVYNTIASGFFDTIGVYKKVSEEQDKLIKQWLDFLRISHVHQKPLATISTSLQRLTLLARALVKNPPLLVLDEPCQGLDEQQVKDFVALVDEWHKQPNKTLIYVSHYAHEIPSCITEKMELFAGSYKVSSIEKIIAA